MFFTAGIWLSEIKLSSFCMENSDALPQINNQVLRPLISTALIVIPSGHAH